MVSRLDFKSYNPTILVIFGGTGHLAEERLIPGLFRLHQKKLLPPLFQVIGFSRQKFSHEEFQARVRGVLRRHGFSGSSVDSFRKTFFYSQGLFERIGGYKKLGALLGQQDGEWRTCANKLFYLAVPPKYYKPIFKSLSASHLTDPCSPEEGWTRVAVEKPFGNDLKTAEELEALLGKLFKEEQIYRIDHYLGKETVRNILAFRFSNSFLEPAWNRDSVERIDIRLFEKSGIGNRGAFYDGVGALRDVGQNHLLQLLALFLMEHPANFEADAIRKARFEILDHLRPMSREEAPRHALRAQYDGYRKEKDVKPDSLTETYFKVGTFVDMPRWRDVPIHLESGKMLAENRVEVKVTFRHPSPCLCPPEAGKHYQNVLRYHIQPEERITTSFWVKRPGPEMVLEEKDFSFDYKQAFSEERADAYERLLLDAISGNQTLFVSTDEIKASWRFTDRIVRLWEKNFVPLAFYKQGTHPAFDVPEETKRKEIGVIGLGKMGKNMALRLFERGWRVVAYDANIEARENFFKEDASSFPHSHELGNKRIEIADDVKDFVKALPVPRAVWTMVPASAVNGVIDELSKLLEKGDTVIDGGNSFYEDSVRRAAKLKKLGIHFLDAGVSGGPAGARNGACLMVGGDQKIYKNFEHLFQDLSAPDGYGYVGKSGAGHFVKMIHNGIEYGMMQALAEGFNVLRTADSRGFTRPNFGTKFGRASADKREKLKYKFDLKKVADIYNHGSVIESRLIGWLRSAFEQYGVDLEEISGTVGHTGEGEWTVKTAKKLGVPADVIERAFKFRVESAKNPSYIGKILSALRNQFGGHEAKSKG